MMAHRGRRPVLRRLAALAGVIVLAVVASCEVRAGGAVLVNGRGEPLTWDTSRPIVFNPDPGPLGQLAAAEARRLAEEAFGIWSAVPSANVSFVAGAPMPCDVDASTVLACGPDELPVFGNGGDGLSPYVFDADGSILDLFFGPGARNDILGFAVIAGGTWLPPVAVEAEALVNGRFFDGIDDEFNPESDSLEAFQAVMVHEIGHWLNLDHSQLNLHVWFDGDLANDRLLPTMFPSSSDDDSQLLTLNADDAAAISTLYPRARGHRLGRLRHGTKGWRFGRQPGAHPRPGRVQGTIYEADGVTPFAGVNVVLRSLHFPEFLAYSALSGARFRPSPPLGISVGEFGGPPDPELRGRFDLGGIPPGFYTLEVEEINPLFTGGSGIGQVAQPVWAPGPNEFWNDDESADPAIDHPGDATVIFLRPGEPRRDFDIILNEPRPPAVLYVVDDEDFAPPDPLGRGVILELDLASGLILNRIPTAGASSQLSDGLAHAASRGTLFWTDGQKTTSVYEIDPTDGTVLNELPWPAEAVSLDGLAFLDGPGQPPGGVLYALDTGLEAVIALDPDTGELLPDLSLLFTTNLFGGIGGSGDDLFVTTAGALIVHLRPAAEQQFIQSFPKPGQERFLMGIAYDGDRLYATSFQLPNFSIWELDPVPATAAGREGSGADILQAIPDPTPVVPRRGGFSAAAVARTGDLDGTQAVNGFDLAVLARSFGAERGATRYAAGADLNRDGVIGPRDLAIFADAMSRPVRTRRR